MMFCIGCKFFEKNWMHKHISIGLFETFETSRQALARSLQDLLEQYSLAKNIITYVKK
jgi:hypothetical protein